MISFSEMTRRQRLYIVGARLYELETRYVDVVEQEKIRRTNDIFWKLIDDTLNENDWLEFCENDKMKKYTKILGEIK